MLDNEEITQHFGGFKEFHCNITEGIIILHCIIRVRVELEAIGGNQAEIKYEFIDG